ncbi:MAG: hydroxymethylbilane synthase [Arenicellales bacterium]
MKKVIKIGTRKSPLALWQAHYVKDAILANHEDIEVELVEIVSTGDKHLETALAKIGGKGLFLKELETALLANEVDIAVHSMKDVTVHLPDGLHIPVICEREDPRDAFVSNHFSGLADLPDGAKVGTCSLRRKSQIAAKYPKLELIDLRGNVNTRLARLDNGDFDAIILAAAGLMRLKFDDRIAAFIETDEMLPAVGQGAVGIECRVDDAEIERLIAPLHHATTAVRVKAERAANEKLGGGCHVPVAAHAELDGDTLTLRALVASVDGKTVLKTQETAAQSEAWEIGERAAKTLITQGADGILKDVYRELGS